MWLAGVFRRGGKERRTYSAWSGHHGDGADDGGEEDELHLDSLVEELSTFIWKLRGNAW